MRLIIEEDVLDYMRDIHNPKFSIGFAFSSLQKMLTRHLNGDYGEITSAAWRQNEQNKKGGAGVIASSYLVNDRQEKYGKIIITEQGNTCTMTLERTS